MNHEQIQDSTPDSNFTPGGRASGGILIAGATSSVVFMAMHPVAHTHELSGFVGELISGATYNGAIHGTLMALGCVTLLGLWGLAERLGPGSLLARAGLIAYAAGQIAGMGAATVNGFILPGLAADFMKDNPDAAEKMRSVMALCQETNGVLSRMDVFAMSIAVLLWSFVMAHRTGASRVVGILGLLCGAAPAIALLAGRLPMNIHGFGAFILAQTIWYVAVGVLMVRGKV